MSRIARMLTFAAALGLGSVLSAQPAPGQGPPFNGRGMGPGHAGPAPTLASLLLARTGELKLTDQQVTRLASVARKASERRTANRPALDSVRHQESRNRVDRPDAQRAGPPPAARALVERIRAQEHIDRRDALAILDPDQLATAFEMSRGARPAGRGRVFGGSHHMRPGMPQGRESGAGPRDGRAGGPPSAERRLLRARAVVRPTHWR